MFRHACRGIPDPARVCACGQHMRRCWIESSGSTRIVQACPTIIDQGGPWHGDKDKLVGHVYVVTTIPHGACNCQGRWIVPIGRPTDLDGTWPLNSPDNLPDELPVHEQIRRAMLDAIGNRVTVDDGALKIYRAALVGGLEDDDQREATIKAALAEAAAVAQGNLQRHHCDGEHTTYRQCALAIWSKWAKAKATGRGRYAAVSWCGRATVVTLHKSTRGAVKQLRRWEDWGCSERCRDSHGVRVLPELPTKKGAGR